MNGQEHNLADSSPCADCYKKMCEVNVKTIVYSSVNGEILKQRLRNYKPKVISLGRQFINNGYNTIYRDNITDRILNYNDETSSSTDNDETSSISSYESKYTSTSYSSYSSYSSSTSSRTTKK